MRYLSGFLLPLFLLTGSSLMFSAALNAQTEAASTAQASDRLLFTDPNQRQRYYDLIAELRCPKCQNQNLADSDAPIASDLRKELHLLISEDYSDAEILQFMQSRYGDFVLYSPPVNSATAVLWILPAGLALLGALIIGVLVLRNRGANNALPGSDNKPANVAEQQQELDKLLNRLQATSSQTTVENRKHDD